MNYITYEAALREAMFASGRMAGYPMSVPELLVYQESCLHLNGNPEGTLNGWAGCFGRHSRLDGCQFSWVYNNEWREFKC